MDTCIAIPASTVGTLIICVNGFLLVLLLSALMFRVEYGIKKSLILLCVASLVVVNVWIYGVSPKYIATPADCATIIGG